MTSKEATSRVADRTALHAWKCVDGLGGKPPSRLGSQAWEWLTMQHQYAHDSAKNGTQTRATHKLCLHAAVHASHDTMHEYE